MKLSDALDMAQYNLRRAILRTILTTLGVIIGIATLSSMVSFGAGMEENIVNVFKKNDLFTSLFVTSAEINLDDLEDGLIDKEKKISPPLNDSTLAIIQGIDGVEIAFAEVSFPASLEFDTNKVSTSIRAMPAEMGNYPPYKGIKWGEYFKSDTAAKIVLSEDMLRRLNIIIKKEKNQKLDAADSAAGVKLMTPNELIGHKINIVTAVISGEKIKSMAGRMVMGMMFGDDKADFNKAQDVNPFESVPHEFEICGILEENSPMGNGRMSADAVIPVARAAELPRTNIHSIWDVLGDRSKSDSAASTYNSIYVRAESMSDMEAVRKKLDEMNFHTFSLADQLDQIRTAFIFIDGILGAIGIVALIVAALGIINTMVMSILERTREIGVMKAIGGGEGDIRLVFFVEAIIIGLIGGALGLAAGWVITEIANLVINGYLKPDAASSIDMFHFPLWLIFGALGFSMCVSLAAGVYPAYRAARIDPVEALRHE